MAVRHHSRLEVHLMQNDQAVNFIEGPARPFARVVANEASSEQAEQMAKKGLFHSVDSGPALNDWPDL